MVIIRANEPRRTRSYLSAASGGGNDPVQCCAPPKYPVAIAGSAVQQSLIAQSPILGWADGQSAAKTQVLEATLLQPAGLPKALEASPIVLGTLGFPSSGDRISDVPTKAKLSATVNCRVK